MIIVNSEGKKVYQGNNKTEAARIIGYNEKTIRRWSKIFEVKENIYGGFTICFNEDLYKPKINKNEQN